MKKQVGKLEKQALSSQEPSEYDLLPEQDSSSKKDFK